MSDECPHPEDAREYDPGNHVPPYGWETYPGWYCLECGEMLNIDEEPYSLADDPDFTRKYELENEMENPL